VHNEEIAISRTTTTNKVWDIGLLYGLQRKILHDLISISVGIALIGGVKRVDQTLVTDTGWYYGSYTREKLLTAGLPIETQLFWHLHKVFCMWLPSNSTSSHP